MDRSDDAERQSRITSATLSASSRKTAKRVIRDDGCVELKRLCRFGKDLD